MKKNFKKNKREKAFTLIETLVAVGIFSVIMMVAVGSLMTIINVSNRTQSIKTTVNNLNYSIGVITDALYSIKTNAGNYPILECLSVSNGKVTTTGLNTDTGPIIGCDSSAAGFGFKYEGDISDGIKYYRIYGYKADDKSPTKLMLGTIRTTDLNWMNDVKSDINILPENLEVLNYDKIFRKNGVGNIPLYTLM
ncbi:MAG: type II secretion system protein, partial [bacterium]